MSKPEETTAAVLMADLAQYAELPVRVVLHDTDDTKFGTAKLVRLEIGFDEAGRRFIAVTGYLE